METIVNARSETVFSKSAFDDTKRAVVPATGWYEWTGQKRKKTAWKLQLRSGLPLLIAAIWDRWESGTIVLDQVATLTCEPNTDVAPIHHRMGVFLATEDVEQWLSGADPSNLLRQLPDGLLDITQTADPNGFG